MNNGNQHNSSGQGAAPANDCKIFVRRDPIPYDSRYLKPPISWAFSAHLRATRRRMCPPSHLDIAGLLPCLATAPRPAARISLAAATNSEQIYHHGTARKFVRQ